MNYLTGDSVPLSTSVKLVGITKAGDEYEISVCNQGVCIEDDAVVDVATRQQLVVRWHNRDWVTKRDADRFEAAENPLSAVPQFFVRVFVQSHNR